MPGTLTAFVLAHVGAMLLFSPDLAGGDRLIRLTASDEKVAP
jgi:hypothetical protein